MTLEVPKTVLVSDRFFNDIQFLSDYTIQTGVESGGFIVKALHGNIGVVGFQRGKDREIQFEINEVLHEGEKYLGTTHAHPVCVIGDFVLVETDRGRVPIKDVNIGDNVLSYNGTYRKVTNKVKFPYKDTQVTITIDLRGYGNKGTNMQKISVTKDHPFRVFRNGIEQWIRAIELIPEDEVLIPEYLIDYCKTCNKIIKTGYKYCSHKCRRNIKNESMMCLNCGKVLEGKKPWTRKYCTQSCRTTHFHKLGLIDTTLFSRMNYDPDFQRKAQIARFATAKKGSRWEKIVYDYLISSGISENKMVRWYPVLLGDYYTYNGTRKIPHYCFIDIAFPERKIAIEVDGEIWHAMRKESDDAKDARLKELGWSILRIPVRKVASKEYTSMLASILPVPVLEDPPIEFVRVPILKVEQKQASHAHAIGLSVEGNNYDDNSFVTNGMLTHNTPTFSRGDVTSYLADEYEQVMSNTGAEKQINFALKIPQVTNIGNITKEQIEDLGLEQEDMPEIADYFHFLYYSGKNELTLQNQNFADFGIDVEVMDEAIPIEELIDRLGIEGVDQLPQNYTTKKWPLMDFLENY